MGTSCSSITAHINRYLVQWFISVATYIGYSSSTSGTRQTATAVISYRLSSLLRMFWILLSPLRPDRLVPNTTSSTSPGWCFRTVDPLYPNLFIYLYSGKWSSGMSLDANYFCSFGLVGIESSSLCIRTRSSAAMLHTTLISWVGLFCYIGGSITVTHISSERTADRRRSSRIKGASRSKLVSLSWPSPSMTSMLNVINSKPCWYDNRLLTHKVHRFVNREKSQPNPQHAVR